MPILLPDPVLLPLSAAALRSTAVTFSSLPRPAPSSPGEVSLELLDAAEGGQELAVQARGVATAKDRYWVLKLPAHID